MKHSILSRDPQFRPCYVSLFVVPSSLRPVLRSIVFYVEELLGVAGFFRVTVKMNFFSRQLVSQNVRRETAVSILHKAKLRKSTMDMEKHCGKVKSRGRGREEQQRLVIVRERKSEIPTEKGVVERRRRRRRRRRKELRIRAKRSSRLFVIILRERVRARASNDCIWLYGQKSRRRENSIHRNSMLAESIR